MFSTIFLVIMTISIETLPLSVSHPRKQGKKLTLSNVPVQVPQTIVTVEGKRESDDELGASLEPSGQVVHELNEVSRVDSRDKGVK